MKVNANLVQITARGVTCMNATNAKRVSHLAGTIERNVWPFAILTGQSSKNNKNARRDSNSSGKIILILMNPAELPRDVCQDPVARRTVNSRIKKVNVNYTCTHNASNNIARSAHMINNA